jgi:hypothetical protein
MGILKKKTQYALSSLLSTLTLIVCAQRSRAATKHNWAQGPQEEKNVWSPEQLEQWRLRQQAYTSDTASVLFHQNLDQRRWSVQQEMTQVLHAFFHRDIPAKTLYTFFQQKIQGEGNVFGLRGMSGGMFFTKLFKSLPDESLLTAHLRSALALPKDAHDGRRRMDSFVQFLEKRIARQDVTRGQVQPARVPFFLSAWWHLQDQKPWPLFQALVSPVLMDEAEVLSPSSVDASFAFRKGFLALRKALAVSPWELEHLVTWYGQRHVQKERRR